MAVGTGFAQLFRSVGQVGGVAVSSAVFQSVLDNELRKRVQGPGSAETIRRIRESARLVASLPPELQREARDSYDKALKAVFFMAMCSTLMAYIVRLPIPDKSLDEPEPGAGPNAEASLNPARADVENVTSSAVTSPLDTPFDSDDEGRGERPPILRTRSSKSNLKRPRRLSSYESVDGGMNLEDDIIGGTARRK